VTGARPRRARARQGRLNLEPTYLTLIDDFNSQLSEPDIKDMKEYLDEFFDILKDDKLFESQILKTCRKDK
jgi:hypothetical protein